MKSDFSGEYVLDRRASTLSAGAAAVQSAVVRISTVNRCVTVIELPGANPFVFLSNELDVARVMDEFLSTTAR